MGEKYDFSGWATRNDLKCSDGRTIRKDAFKHNDGSVVPLVWNHQHNDPLNVLGHALLENRDNGVYTYCTFNDTPAGVNAKELVKHGDVTALSIYANRLQQQGSNVLHGEIREVSLVLAGANPGAYIDSVLAHGEYSSDDEAIIYTGEEIELTHSEEAVKEEKEKEVEDMTEDKIMHAESEKTVQEIFDSMTEEQKTVCYAMIGEALEQSATAKTDDNEKGEKEEMKHNVFANEREEENVLTHSDMEEIFSDAKRYGSLKDAVLAHGITDIDILFPDAKNVNREPDFIKREDAWVSVVMNGTHHTPFSRIRSIHANITADEARAKGYTKGNLKVDEVIALLKRETTPTTIYKKQSLDRDDVLDIIDFDVVSWLKGEMRGMLNEEIARAIMVGDGRLSSSNDKINPLNIRPIWTDADLYTVKKVIEYAAADTDDDKAKNFIKTAIKARKDYKGTGNPTLFCTEDMLTSMLLMEDAMGRVIYDSEAKLATALRVSKIVTVPVMENLTREAASTESNDNDHELAGIIVNLADYNVGADKGGNVAMFDDFDIDYNKQKYLIETRCSGALVKPYSAIAIEFQAAKTTT